MNDLTVFNQLYGLKNKYNNNQTASNGKLGKMETELFGLDDLNDAALANQIYGDQVNPSTYRSLKSRFKEKMITDILIASSNKAKNSIREKQEAVYREYAAVQIAGINGQMDVQELLAAELIKKSRKYHVTEVTVGTAWLLYHHHLFYDVSTKKADKFYKIYESSNQILILERVCRKKYSELSPILKKQKIDSKDISTMCLDFYEEYISLAEETPSFNFNRMLYLIGCIGYYLSRDYQNMYRVANEALHFLLSLPFRSLPVEAQFKRFIVRSQLLQGEYSLGIPILLELIESSNKKSISWFNSYQLLIQLYMMTGRNNEAVTCFETVEKNLLYKSLPTIFKNDWLILEAYLNFVQLQNPELGKPTMSRFRINKFINNNPELTESKRMYNIQLIVAQLLFYFHDRNYRKIEERIDAVSKYTSRYLRKDETYRSQVFIKMLAEIPRQNYTRLAIERHTNKFNKKLSEYPTTMDIGMDNIEIIPYEKLWEMILSKMRR